MPVQARAQAGVLLWQKALILEACCCCHLTCMDLGVAAGALQELFRLGIACPTTLRALAPVLHLLAGASSLADGCLICAGASC